MNRTKTSQLSVSGRAARLLHLRNEKIKAGEPVAPPLVNASTFHLPGHNGFQSAPFQYGRFSNPTWEAVEEQLSLLEDASAIAFPAGMASIAAVFYATLKAGDTVVIPADGYHATRHLAENFLSPLGVQFAEVSTTEMARSNFDGSSLVLVETPSNPMLDVCDLRVVGERAHKAGALLAVDNTTMTPLLQRPLDRGADIVVAADTKAPAGHSDVLFGHVATRDDALAARLRDWRKVSGCIPGPFEAWLVHRGLETLEVRLARMTQSAQIIAERLASHSAIGAVRYPGLPDDPSHEIGARQMDGFGFLTGFTLKDADTAEGFLERCSLVAQTTSFGGVHSSAERRARWGDHVPEGYIRLSVGCEPVEELWAAIDGAL